VARSEGQILKSTSAVEEGLQLATELRQSFANISSAVADVYQHAREIGDATKQQASGSTLIAQATGHLTQLTQEMASSIEQQSVATKNVAETMDSMLGGSREISSNSAELAVSAEQMSRMSQYLLQIMARFQIPEARERPLPAGFRTPVRALART
jgi:methyl-accepting chemotaxis protein